MITAAHTTYRERPAFSIPSIIAILAAGATFLFEGADVLLAIIAIVAGVIGALMALLPGVRGGIVSILSIVVGVIAIVVSIFQIIL